MEKKGRKNDTSKEFAHLDLDAVNAGSSMDCTGLIPFAPKTEAEEESYKQLYDFNAEINRNRERQAEPYGKAKKEGRSNST